MLGSEQAWARVGADTSPVPPTCEKPAPSAICRFVGSRQSNENPEEARIRYRVHFHAMLTFWVF